MVNKENKIKMPVIEMNEFITGEKFTSFCDVTCEKPVQHFNDNYQQEILDCEESVIILFCQTHNLCKVTAFLSTCKNKKFIIVSHNSDGTVGYKQGRDFDYQWRQGDNIYYWFCQNVDVIESNVVPIPIGLENEYNFKDKTSVVKFSVMCDWNARQISKADKMYVCFNRHTNPGQRNYAYDKFSKLPWVTAEEGYNGVNNVNNYFDKVAHHQFILSPDGNGMDCVRTWESLYMGAIPIVMKHVFTDWYARYLPVIVVNSLDEIDLDMLNEKKAEFEKRTFNYDVLTISYWKNRIAKTKEFICALPLP